MGITFLLNKIISNQYSVEDFGTYNLIKRAVSIVSFVMLMAMGIAIPKYISEANELNDQKLKESYMLSSLSLIIITSLTLTTILLIFKDSISKLMFGSSQLSNYILPICMYAFSAGLITYTYSFYRGINNFGKFNIIGFNLQLLTLLTVLFIKDNLLLLHYSWSILLLIYATFEILTLYKKYNFSFKNYNNKLGTLKTLFEYGFPRVPGDFVLFAFNLAPMIVVNSNFGTEQVAFFSAALSINALITPVFSLVGTILLPFVSKSMVNNSVDNMKNKIKVLGVIYIIISLISIFIIYLFGETILILLFNSDYVNSIQIVKIVIISILPNAFYLLLRSPLDGVSKFPYNTICLMVSFIIYIILLICSNTIEMVACSVVITYTILGLLSLGCWILALRRTNINPSG
nr:Wzx [Streptococcus suis]APZ78937.1 Wzx [Streptococcus suis]